MNFELNRFHINEKEVLNEMLYNYLKEIAPQDMEGLVFSQFSYQYLDLYWQEVNRIPLKIQYGTQTIGFAMLNDYIVYKSFKAEKAIAEFYIKPSFRLKNIGKRVAFELFDTYRGKWEVRQSKHNYSAYKFWNKIISEYTQNSFEEVIFQEETIQLFRS